MEKIDLFLYQHHVGCITFDARQRSIFTYAQSWLSHAEAYPVSLSMPLSEKPYGFKDFKRWYRFISQDPMARHVQPDIVHKELPGALNMCGTALGRKVKNQTKIDISTLGTSLAKLSRPLPSHNNSLSKMQQRYATTIIDNVFFETHPPHIHSHALKLQIPTIDDLVTNEIFCTLLADRIGITTLPVSRMTLDSESIFITERVDRLLQEDGTIMPLHVEPLGVGAATGGNSASDPLARIFHLFRQHSKVPVFDFKNYLNYLCFAYIIGADDADPFSQFIVLSPQGVTLAPIHELYSSAVYEQTAPQLLRALFQKSEAHAVNRSDIIACAKRLGVGAKYIFECLDSLSLKSVSQAAEILNEFPTLVSPITEHIAHIIRSRAKVLQQALNLAA